MDMINPKSHISKSSTAQKAKCGVFWVLKKYSIRNEP